MDVMARRRRAKRVEMTGSDQGAGPALQAGLGVEAFCAGVQQCCPVSALLLLHL